MKIDKELFKEFPDNSKVWIYQSDRELTPEEIEKLEEELVDFADGWAAHGNKLSATATVLNPYFSIMVVNDDLAPPSGCSVDVLNTFMKGIGKRLNVDFFDRMKVIIQDGEKVKQIHFSALENHKGSLIFDPLVSTLGEFREEWPKPIEKSNFGQLETYGF